MAVFYGFSWVSGQLCFLFFLSSFFCFFLPFSFSFSVLFWGPNDHSLVGVIAQLSFFFLWVFHLDLCSISSYDIPICHYYILLLQLQLQLLLLLLLSQLVFAVCTGGELPTLLVSSSR